MINKTIVKKIKNNATLIYTRKVGDPFVSITYGFQVGSVNETDSIRGISHFIEHMSFNGTKHFEKEEIVSIPECCGGNINANTCKNVTQYEVQVLSQYLKEGIELANDLVFNPSFPEKYLDKEKNIVLQEIKDSEDKHWNIAFDMRNSLFTKSNLQFPVLGFEDIVSSFTREELIKYHDKFYVPDNCIISICGDVDELLLTEMIESYLPNNNNKIVHKKYENVEVSDNSISKEKNGITQCKLLKSFMFPNSEKSKFVILSYILGQSMNSRLFEELREKQGLCYQVGCMVENHTKESNLFTMYMSYEDESKTEHILNEMDRLVNEMLGAKPITEKEMNQAKAFTLGQAYRVNEQSDYVSSNKVRKFAFNDVLNSEDSMNLLQAVTVDDMVSAIKNNYKNTFYSILKPGK